jgi:hypothetical protein
MTENWIPGASFYSILCLGVCITEASHSLSETLHLHLCMVEKSAMTHYLRYARKSDTSVS